MSPKPHTVPEIRAILVSFDVVPHYNEDLVQMVRYDLSRMKGVTKQKRALAGCNGYRVWRSKNEIRIDFVDKSMPEDRFTRFRMIYQLIA
jgi:hypothetical protein